MTGIDANVVQVDFATLGLKIVGCVMLVCVAHPKYTAVNRLIIRLTRSARTLRFPREVQADYSQQYVRSSPGMLRLFREHA